MKPFVILDAFVATRQDKKITEKVKQRAKRNQKTGAGREVIYKTYTNERWISEAELQKMKNNHPELKVIPTRWVEVDKAEVGQEPVMKSRIVLRGDLEDASRMRTDPPTCSQLMLSTVLTLSACRDVDLWAGDISAAYKVQRWS
jgi:hypothetical protein